MGIVSRSSTKRPSSPACLNLSPCPPPGSAFWPPSLYSCCACHPPTCSVSSPPPPPAPALPHLQQGGLLLRLPRKLFIGIRQDQKQRPVLTEAWSCREGGSRLPNSFWTTKEVVTPEPRANGGGEANLHQDSGPGVMFLRVSLTVSARLGVGAAAYSPAVPPSAWNWSSLMNS